MWERYVVGPFALTTSPQTRRSSLIISLPNSVPSFQHIFAEQVFLSDKSPTLPHHGTLTSTPTGMSYLPFSVLTISQLFHFWFSCKWVFSNSLIFIGKSESFIGVTGVLLSFFGSVFTCWVLLYSSKVNHIPEFLLYIVLIRNWYWFSPSYEKIMVKKLSNMYLMSHALCWLHRTM